MSTRTGKLPPFRGRFLGRWGEEDFSAPTEEALLKDIAEDIELTLDAEMDVRGLDTVEVEGRTFYVKLAVTFIPG